MTTRPIVHTSIAAAREFYRLRRLGFDREEASMMSKYQIRFENCRFVNNSVAYRVAA